MFHAANQGYDCRQRTCALVVVLAVCALTVKLATRFDGFHSASTPAITTVQQHVCRAPNRQRLMTTAIVWFAPLIRASLLDTTTSYPRIAPSGPPIPGILFEQSLYNRPPPAFIPA